MNHLINAIHTTPIIDNHAHPLLKPSAQSKHPFISITSEAHGDAISAAKSSLSHIRAVKQLSNVLNCEDSWEAVESAIEKERSKPEDVWAKKCFEGVETVLVDDGLDGADDVFEYQWHDRLTRGKCKRIVRVEKVAENIIEGLLKETSPPTDFAQEFAQLFFQRVRAAIDDPEVVGFKSVICYRSGLGIAGESVDDGASRDEINLLFEVLKITNVTQFKRIEYKMVNDWIVHRTAELIRDANSGHKKPFQFHTGLGDNDITLTSSSPSHMQPFIRNFPTVPIILLHASYPWTQEAGYLASVYSNVYADIGEVFPFLSQEGQERVVREILEICPTQKILWSTDGHWFPETYLLAIIQVREALEVVLLEYVQKKVLSVKQAVRAVEDILFTTSNDVYNLGLKLEPFPLTTLATLLGPSVSDLTSLTTFLGKHPDVKFLRLQYLDYTATIRLRIIPVKKALAFLKENDHLSTSIAKVSLGLLQNDTPAKGITPSGGYKLEALLSTIRPGPSKGYASMQCEFRESDGSELNICPRSTLRRVLSTAKNHNLEFLIGFEIEIVFLSRSPLEENTFTPLKNSSGHSWHSVRSLHEPKMLLMLEEIYDTLAAADIDLETWHPESSTGQYEFVLPPYSPLKSIDTLIHAREIITVVAAKYELRATLHPKPFPHMAGTACHAHFSISSPPGNIQAKYESFYAGILKHLPSILAFTYSSPVSYDRLKDSSWAGGRYIAWGTENRETSLRKIEDSHWEIRCLDGLANMYLAFAAIITAGTASFIKGGKLMSQDFEADPAALSAEERGRIGIDWLLPGSLGEALGYLEGDKVLNEGLGRSVVERYICIKEGEVDMLTAANLLGGNEKKFWDWVVERY